MDPISIGTIIGGALVSKLTGKLMEKAADPANVAKSVNWVFTAADHFLKIRKGEKNKDEAIPKPQPPGQGADLPGKISEQTVEEKTREVESIAKSSPEQGSLTGITDGVRVARLTERAMREWANDIESLMEQLEFYLQNLRDEERKVAAYGGWDFTPPIVKNTVRAQRVAIAERVERLNGMMKGIYGVEAAELNTLLQAAKS